MSSLLAPALAAGVGAVVGELVRRHVVRGSHRRPDDDGPPRAHRWLPAAAALTWFLLVRTSWPDDAAWTAVVAAVSVPLLWLTAVDLEVRRLPDRVTLPLLLVVPALVGVLALLTGEPAVLGRALLAGLVLGVCFAGLAMVGEGMGGGDVKLAPTLGVLLGVLGWPQVLLAVLLMFVSASAYGLALVLFRGAGRRTMFAFGPFLIGGALAVLAVGA